MNKAYQEKLKLLNAKEVYLEFRRLYRSALYYYHKHNFEKSIKKCSVIIKNYYEIKEHADKNTRLQVSKAKTLIVENKLIQEKHGRNIYRDEINQIKEWLSSAIMLNEKNKKAKRILSNILIIQANEKYITADNNVFSAIILRECAVKLLEALKLNPDNKRAGALLDKIWEDERVRDWFKQHRDDSRFDAF
jgi:hypothetical protein